MTIDDLVGIHTIDARGEYIRDANPDSYSENSLVILYRIDGKLYAFQEDTNDDYRSMLEEVREANERDLEIPLAEFAPIVCNFMIRDLHQFGGTDHVLYAVDERTDLLVLEIGTENTDDYYPSFVASWTPEGVPLPEWLLVKEQAS